MNSSDLTFGDLFTYAHWATFKKKSNRYFELLYGFTGEDIHTLEQIAQEEGVSRESIRSTIDWALTVLRKEGERQIDKGNFENPCAELILFLNEKIKPSEEGELDRMFHFAKDSMSHLRLGQKSFSLIAKLIYSDKAQVRRSVSELGRINRAYNVLLREEAKARANQARNTKILQNWLNGVEWPRNVSQIKKETICNMPRKRNVTVDDEGNIPSFQSSKMNSDIQYESGLEYEFLLSLEHLDEVVAYREQPYVIPYDFKSEKRSYYPDVLLMLNDGRGVIVELKPRIHMALHQNLAKREALQDFCKEKGLGFLITDGKTSILELQRHPIREDFEQAVKNELSTGPLDWQRWYPIKSRYKPSWEEFWALIIVNQFEWQRGPFELKRGIYSIKM